MVDVCHVKTSTKTVLSFWGQVHVMLTYQWHYTNNQYQNRVMHSWIRLIDMQVKANVIKSALHALCFVTCSLHVRYGLCNRCTGW